MKKNGFTLIEVIISIALIGIISIAFLRLITLSYTSLRESEKFTQNMFNDQALVEEQIDALRFKDPEPPKDREFNFFGMDITVHDIQVSTSSSGEVQVFLPKQTTVPPVPIIENSPEIIVRNESDMKISPQPAKIDLLNDSRNLFVGEVMITSETRNDHLMNIYRWYITDEVSESDIPSNDTSKFTIIHEWNEARAIVPLKKAIEDNLIPNFKEYLYPEKGKRITYNRLNLSAIKSHAELDNESMINKYGNRHVIYGVTPISLAGRIGQESFSDSIYIEAPRINIESSMFHLTENTVVIEFDKEVEETFNESLFFLNEHMPSIKTIIRDQDDHKKIIIEFQEELNKATSFENNFISRGGIRSKNYGAISIWVNGEPNAEFTIN